jgi:protein phosphatase
MTSLPEDHLPDSYEDRAYVMAVADGIGGSAAGEVASSMALRAVVHLVLNAAKWAFKLDDDRQRPAEVQEAKDRAAEFMRRVDQTLTQTSERHPELRGMGTTLTASYSVGDDLFIIHIGDSRAYLYRQGVLQQLTNDHTIAQALASVGAITQEEASTHYLRHVLTRAVGSQGGQIEAEITQYRLADGDRLLLCSDGLSDMVSDQQIAGVLARNDQSTAACRELVNLALENGGKDNITVALAGYRMPPRPDSKNTP